MPAPNERITRTGTLHPCPACGSRDVAAIQYGLPMFSQDLERDLEAGERALGGCVVWSEMPDCRCNACRAEFTEDGELAGTAD